MVTNTSLSLHLSSKYIMKVDNYLYGRHIVPKDESLFSSGIHFCMALCFSKRNDKYRYLFVTGIRKHRLNSRSINLIATALF